MASNELESAVMKLLQSSEVGVQAQQNSLGGTLSTLAGAGGGDTSGDNAATALSGAVERAAGINGGGVAESVERLAGQIGELTGVARLQVDSTEANTSAVIENSLLQGSNGESTAGNIGKSVLSFLSGGLGLVQLFGGLFGGGSPETETVLSGYSLPPSVNIEAGLGGLVASSVQPITYGQNGLPRTAGAGVPTQVPTVNVQVTAMDSRSFLDHSDDIARAVKEAMLNSHSLNDVVTEL